MDLKKLAGQAGQFLTRAVQYTEEKLGNAEKTELDGHFESLAIQADSASKWTEKMVAGAEAVLIPNPGNRVEDFVFEKIEKRRPNRLSNLEYLGLDMVQSGNEFGPGTAYGSALLKVGGAEQRLGLQEREFIGNAVQGYVQPMRKFLDSEMKTIMKERRVLEAKRLDLDACKGRLRKARSMEAQGTAEADLRRAQADFDRQTEITKLLLEGVRSSQAAHLRHLNELVDAQCQYYESCNNVMIELKKELASLSLNPESGSAAAGNNNIIGGSSNFVVSDDEVSAANIVTATTTAAAVVDKQQQQINGQLEDGPWRRAKVVCDYDAASMQELCLMMNEVVTFSDCNGETSDFVFAKRGNQTGRVPRAYLEPMDD